MMPIFGQRHSLEKIIARGEQAGIKTKRGILTVGKGGMVTEDEYEVALAEVWELMNSVPDTEEGSQSAGGRRLMALVLEVVAYEEEHYPMPPPEEVDDD